MLTISGWASRSCRKRGFPNSQASSTWSSSILSLIIIMINIILKILLIITQIKITCFSKTSIWTSGGEKFLLKSRPHSPIATHSAHLKFHTDGGCSNRSQYPHTIEMAKYDCCTYKEPLTGSIIMTRVLTLSLGWIFFCFAKNIVFTLRRPSAHCRFPHPRIWRRVGGFLWRKSESGWISLEKWR